MKLVLTLLIISLSVLPLAASEIYHYRDAEGKLIVVDDPELIPPQCSGQKVAAPTTQGITSPQWSPSQIIAVDEPSREESTGSEETPIEIYGNQVVVPVELHHRNRDVTVHLVFRYRGNHHLTRSRRRGETASEKMALQYRPSGQRHHCGH